MSNKRIEIRFSIDQHNDPSHPSWEPNLALDSGCQKHGQDPCRHCDGGEPEPHDEICRECREGKCVNCDGTAWSNDLDEMVGCACRKDVHER